jgi:hypothetical protein
MWHHSLRHAIYLVLALGVAAFCYATPVAFWYRSGWLWLLLVSLLLILVLVPGVGRNVNGSQRWLALGPLTLQPSELAKAAVTALPRRLPGAPGSGGARALAGLHPAADVLGLLVRCCCSPSRISAPP